MTNSYASVRRLWRDVEPERDLKALWRSERFEQPRAIEDALRVYDLAIRVEGWATVSAWAIEALSEGRILNAHLVELAMRALEQGDVAFLRGISERLLERSAPTYFRFWETLFRTRHAHQGERLFRAQLAALSDYRVVKYRRHVRAILRRLRFRCETPREHAIGAIAFAMLDKLDLKAYPSAVFASFVACHAAAHNPPKDDRGKALPKTKQAALFAEKAAELGIWSVVEGIRTSVKLPRTLDYLSAMAPKMTDTELVRALRAFDQNLATADHKKAPQKVVALAEHLHGRLARMDLPLETWAKIYPYLSAPVLVRLLEDLLEPRLDAAREALRAALGSQLVPVPIVSTQLEARAYRCALLLGWLLYDLHRDAGAYLVDASRVRALVHPEALTPYGYAATPPTWRWQPEPDRHHRTGLGLVRETFPAAAKRRSSETQALGQVPTALRHHLYRRALVDSGAGASDVPVVFLPGEPEDDERRALLAYLGHFPGAVLVRFEQRWKEPLEAPGVLCIELPTGLDDAVTALGAQAPALAHALATFDLERRVAVDRAVRAMRLAPAPPVEHIAQGPHYRGA